MGTDVAGAAGQEKGFGHFYTVIRCLSARPFRSNDIGDSVGGLAVPERGNRRAVVGSVDNPGERGKETFGFGSDQGIRSLFASDRPFGMLAQGQARNVEHGRLFLNSAGIGYGEFGVRNQIQKIVVAERFGNPQVRHLCHPVEQAESFGVFAGAGVDREDDRVLPLDFVDDAENARESFRVVDVSRPVKRHDAVTARLDVHFAQGRKFFRAFKMGKERIGDHAPDVENLVPVAPLPSQIGDRRGFGAEEERTDRIGDDPVDLFGHGPVAAPQARLNVDERNAQMYRCQAAGDRAADIVDDQHHVGAVFFADRFECLHDRGGLARRRAAVDPQVVKRLGNLEFVEEKAAHLLIEMLAGMNEDRLDFGMRVERADNRRDLRKVGTRSDCTENFDHLSVSGFYRVGNRTFSFNRTLLRRNNVF